MYRLNLEKGVQSNIWLNEELAEGRCNGSKIIMEEYTNLLAYSKKLLLSCSFPGHIIIMLY